MGSCAQSNNPFRFGRLFYHSPLLLLLIRTKTRCATCPRTNKAHRKPQQICPYRFPPREQSTVVGRQFGRYPSSPATHMPASSILDRSRCLPCAYISWWTTRNTVLTCQKFITVRLWEPIYGEKMCLCYTIDTCSERLANVWMLFILSRTYDDAS